MNRVLYKHDGQGDLILEGPLATVRITLERGRERFDPIEAWRARTEKTFSGLEEFAGEALAEVDGCMSSLLRAVDEADAYRAKWGEPLNPAPARLSARMIHRERHET